MSSNSISEGIRAVRQHSLRSSITVLIIGTGITAFMGVLTTIEGIQTAIRSSFNAFGVNHFGLQPVGTRPGRHPGGPAERVAPFSYRQVQAFKRLYAGPGTVVSLEALLHNALVAQSASRKTNPTSLLAGVEADFLLVKRLEIAAGRNFSPEEIAAGRNVAIVGAQVAEALFGKASPLYQSVRFYGQRYTVVGVLKEQGAAGNEEGADKSILIPLNQARLLSGRRPLRYRIAVDAGTAVPLAGSVDQATRVMRAIRQDGVHEENSFEVTESKALVERLDKLTRRLRTGGVIIGVITLLGASINLGNIMLISVTERTREIGIRKAVGAKPGAIRNQFLLETGIICLAGSLIGIVLGVGAGNLVSRLFKVKELLFPWQWMAFAVGLGALIALLAGYLPAYKASKIDPIRALRFE